jgi:mannan endo-1,4-beta-mannosidase
MRRIFFLLLLLSTICSILGFSQPGFVKQHKGRFYKDGKPYRYIGTNYWYGIYLPLIKDEQRGIGRLRKELDFLQQQGITNLRILAGAEGSGKILGNYRVGPPLQTAKGIFDTAVLYGLDVLLNEMSKRNMKAVIFFSNNWEWSGGFLQYLNWNGIISDSVLQAKMEWEDMRDQIAKFYTCEPCKSDYKKQVDVILSRINLVNGKRYTDDATIMGWQIANEPRPMRSTFDEAYKKWIAEVAAHVKSVDKNHLVSIGHEGEVGTQNFDLYKAIHDDVNIDYLTIHIWPKNWGWMKAETMRQDYRKVEQLTSSYLNKHAKLAYELKKPLVVEEFGFPRNDMSFDAGTVTSLRDHYYSFLFSQFTNPRNENRYSRMIAGMNFWSFNGLARPIPGQRFWKTGDDYMGDPPMEEQSLYGVFDADTSTWNVIRKHVKLLQKK